MQVTDRPQPDRQTDRATLTIAATDGCWTTNACDGQTTTIAGKIMRYRQADRPHYGHN